MPVDACVMKLPLLPLNVHVVCIPPSRSEIKIDIYVDTDFASGWGIEVFLRSYEREGLS